MIQQSLAVSTAIILSVSLLSPQPQQNEDSDNSISHISITDAGSSIGVDSITSDSHTKTDDKAQSPRGESDETPTIPESKHQDSGSSPGISEGLKNQSNDSGGLLQSFNLPTCRITQSEDSHHTPEGGHSFALDYACVQGVSYDVLAPDFKDLYIVAYVGYDARLGDFIVLRHGEERYIFGHTQTTRKVGEKIEPGFVIGQSNESGHAEGIHTHAEYWRGRVNMTFDGKRTNEFSSKLCTQREWQFCQAKKVEAKTVKSKVTCRADMAQDMVQYAYDIGGIDFVGTISAESKFDPHAVGDSGKSYGYCQIHHDWNLETQNKYRALTTNKERMDFCFKIYRGYVEAGNIENRLYGYRVRYTKGLPKLNISCK